MRDFDLIIGFLGFFVFFPESFLGSSRKKNFLKSPIWFQLPQKWKPHLGRLFFFRSWDQDSKSSSENVILLQLLAEAYKPMKVSSLQLKNNGWKICEFSFWDLVFAFFTGELLVLGRVEHQIP